ncbi:hypothetical protein Aperf_G00000080680 [Anoplocephala perfoliata]
MMDQRTNLISGLAGYKYRDEAKSDIEKASQAFRSLLLKLQDYTADNGQTSRLLCLDGTIPVKYEGKSYNIPLAVYFTRQHPYHPPIAYVRPTSNMQIKPSRNVDTNGKIFLPYLSEWEHPKSSTKQLLETLQIVFGVRAPVFSKTNVNLNPPVNYGFNPQIAAATNGNAYPAPGSFWTGLPTPNNSASGSAFQPPLFGGGMMPPIPPATASSTYLGTSNSLAGMMSEEEQLLFSLRTAVLDKLNKEYREVSDNLNCEIQSLQSTEADLISRGTKNETILAQMVSESDQVRSLTRELKAKTKDYEEAYRKLKQEVDSKVDYDSVVDTTTPVYKQLVEAFAEEQAIGDVIYYLSQALENNAIEPDDFLRAVRDQSRSQFMKRAMVYQCRAKAGLPPV